MKVRTSIVGITLMTAGLVGAAGAQGPGLPMTPAGNPTKQEAKCLFGHPAETAAAAVPPQTGSPDSLISNATVGPTGTSALPGEAEISQNTGRPSMGSVFVSTSNPANVGLQC
jgi:hypothetical protein